MTEEPVPVTLIAGYLGAGKTTWLNARIRSGIPDKALILVNDFGAINIDADLIEYRSDRLVRLSNGCICCSLNESLAVQLAQIARWPSRPSAVYIETSGVAQPRRIIDLITVSRQFRVQQTVGLVDGYSVLDKLADTRVGALVAAQIEAADWLSLNRLGLVAAGRRAEVRQRLAQLNPKAEIVTDASEAPDEGLKTCAGRDGSRNFYASERRAACTTKAAHVENGPAWRRFAIALSQPVDRADLEDILERHAGTLARAKGILEETSQGKAVFQWSGGRASWTATLRGGMVGQLVGVGHAGADFDALLGELERL